MRDWATLGVSPPADKTDRVQTGRFLRSLILRTVIAVVPVWVIVCLTDSARWLVIVAVVSVGVCLLDVLWLTLRIRRDETR